MSTIVCKFGGSSVSDAGMFQQVLRIVRSLPERRYIVLSAPGKRFTSDEKVTDLFYRMHACRDSSILSQIFSRYAAIRDALSIDFPLEDAFQEILAGLHASPDYAASRGEYLCARLFSAYAQIPFIDSAELIFFHPNGKIDWPRSHKAVLNRLAPLPHAVIPGFYGTGADGEIRTFARGGSDVSGALLSVLLNTDLYENWTDVNGLYTADPELVRGARHNLEVNRAQMERIARSGAQLLHPDALALLKDSGIDVLLKNTFHPEHAGTRISEHCTRSVCCVTGRRMQYLQYVRPAEQHAAPVFQLHSHPVCGALPVAVINTFGLSETQSKSAEKLLKPIHIIHMQDLVQIIIAPSEYEDGIRTVHAILTERESPDSIR